ncbi:unnamed protein product, partial [Effrenium voratum]
RLLSTPSGNEADDLTPGSRRRASISPAAGNYIKASTMPAQEEDQEHHSRIWKFLTCLTSEHVLSNITGVVVMIDAFLTCYDIDQRAAGETPSTIVGLLSDACLMVYTLELILLCIANGVRVLCERSKDVLFMVDLVVLVCGYVELLLEAFGLADFFVQIGMLRMLRVARIMRLTRLLRKSSSLKELRRLLTMMATCMKALAWSFLMCFGVMTFWAMLMVEVIHPLVQNLANDEFGDCEQCIRATSSVMSANLLLFKTVIAGDSWGLIAVPVIEAHPFTAFLFVGSQLTLVFGVLNLIVAVVVDTFAEARAHDVLNLAEELEQDMKLDKISLRKIFDRIDEDGSGTVTIDELIDGARKDPEFQSRLQVMDIDEVDLQQLFEMIDTEGSGQVHAKDFIGPLSRWVRDSKTAPRFVKYNVMRLMHLHTEHSRSVDQRFEMLAQRFDEMLLAMRHGMGGDRTISESISAGSLSMQMMQFRNSAPVTDRFQTNEVEAVEQPKASLSTSVSLLPGARPVEQELLESMEAGAGVRNPRSTEPGSTFAVIYCSKWDDMRHVRQTKNRRWEGVQRPWLNSPLKACMMYQFHVVVFVSYYEQFRARAMFNACLCTCAAAYFAAKAFRADLLESVNALYSSILQRRSLDELPEGRLPRRLSLPLASSTKECSFPRSSMPETGVSVTARFSF